MADLVNLLNRLGQDARFAEDFERNPEDVLSRFDLDDKQLKAVLGGDGTDIRRAVGFTETRATNKNISTYD